MASKESFVDRFWSKVDRSGDCWIWTAARTTVPGGKGYGLFWQGTRVVVAHRWIYEQTFGPIPAGLHCCHKCDVPACVRPDHLFTGTPKDNSRDCSRKGRLYLQRFPNKTNLLFARRAQGEKHWSAKLTNASVQWIRERHSAGETLTSLASKLGVSRATVGYVISGKTWKTIK